MLGPSLHLVNNCCHLAAQSSFFSFPHWTAVIAYESESVPSSQIIMDYFPLGHEYLIAVYLLLDAFYALCSSSFSHTFSADTT